MARGEEGRIEIGLPVGSGGLLLLGSQEREDGDRGSLPSCCHYGVRRQSAGSGRPGFIIIIIPSSPLPLSPSLLTRKHPCSKAAIRLFWRRASERARDSSSFSSPFSSLVQHVRVWLKAFKGTGPRKQDDLSLASWLAGVELAGEEKENTAEGSREEGRRL